MSLPTPYPFSLSPYEGEREGILERGLYPLSYLHSLRERNTKGE